MAMPSSRGLCEDVGVTPRHPLSCHLLDQLPIPQLGAAARFLFLYRANYVKCQM